MLTLSRMGAMVIPPMPSFYNHPRTVDDIVDYTVARILDQFGLEVRGVPRWTGEMGVGPSSQ
jgi:4-hydroxy-3-polyprenylbenzoate decarboxylase